MLTLTGSFGGLDYFIPSQNEYFLCPITSVTCTSLNMQISWLHHWIACDDVKTCVGITRGLHNKAALYGKLPRERAERWKSNPSELGRLRYLHIHLRFVFGVALIVGAASSARYSKELYHLFMFIIACFWENNSFLWFDFMQWKSRYTPALTQKAIEVPLMEASIIKVVACWGRFFSSFVVIILNYTDKYDSSLANLVFNVLHHNIMCIQHIFVEGAPANRTHAFLLIRRILDPFGLKTEEKMVRDINFIHRFF